MKRKLELNRGWQLFQNSHSESESSPQVPVEGLPARVPGTVHADLLAAGLIPDPFVADQEKEVTWVQESDWEYRLNFQLPEAWLGQERIYLVCEGLDTICRIHLNGKFLGQTDNMFRRYRFQIARFLQRENELSLLFESPLKYTRNQENQHGKLPVALNSERVYIRKAQYSFGWDWGPSLPTSGIWRPVYLWLPPRLWIENVRFHTLELRPEQAVVRVEAELEGELKTGDRAVIELIDGEKVLSQELELKNLKFAQDFSVENPRLWWPNGMGSPQRYRLRILILDRDGNRVHSVEKKVGIRTIELLTEEENRPVFKFLVNGKAVFVKGVNWIPADSFLPRVKETRYRMLLQSVRDAHVNMVRVWGGGIYEDDRFYEICDELGLMVWQDFMFACGAYPNHQSFLENVQQEIVDNVNRLQHHPCLAIWCGNNENEWLWYMETGRELSEMPGHQIFHSLIPGLVRRMDPTRPYWPSSPFGQEPDPNSEQSGNRHQWNIWSIWQDYTTVVRDRSLFVTEFGFQAPAPVRTLNRVIPASERHPQSYLFEWHNKQEEGTERLFRFLAAHLPVETRWNDFNYLTQLNQGLALKTCLKHWRLRWPKTAGAIIWQLNDCWPVVSWSLVDYYLYPKLAYFFVRQAFSPQTVFLTAVNGILRVQVLNDSTEPLDGWVSISLFATETGTLMDEQEEPIHLEPGSRLNKQLSLSLDNPTWLAIATLKGSGNQILNRDWFSPRRWKHIRLPISDVRVVSDQQHFYLTSSRLSLFNYVPNLSLKNAEDTLVLLPGEKIPLRLKEKLPDHTGKRRLRIFNLNRYLKQRD